MIIIKIFIQTLEGNFALLCLQKFPLCCCSGTPITCDSAHSNPSPPPFPPTLSHPMFILPLPPRLYSLLVGRLGRQWLIRKFWKTIWYHRCWWWFKFRANDFVKRKNWETRRELFSIFNFIFNCERRLKWARGGGRSNGGLTESKIKVACFWQHRSSVGGHVELQFKLGAKSRCLSWWADALRVNWRAWVKSKARLGRDFSQDQLWSIRYVGHRPKTNRWRFPESATYPNLVFPV